MDRYTPIVILIITLGIAVPSVLGTEHYQLTNNNKNYAPVQPIPFSHRLHAGELKIECQYCHVGADQSRHASIPHLSTCMNCHTEVKGSTVDGKAAIAKMQDMFNRDEPIKWVRVHRLPDFAYFNHSAHIHKGIKCQDCHGPVEEMGTMKQFSDLSMGWCVNCHRKYEGQTYAGLIREDGKPHVLHPPLDCAACHR